jgi:polysaccharide biosynthesis protein PelG
MAGIGFVLRKLVARDDYMSVARAYIHSTSVAVGPWILSVITLAYISFLTSDLIGRAEVNEFYAVLIYNFLFSFLAASPIYMVSARYTADCLYRRDASPVPGIFISSGYILTIPALIFGSLFYIFYATMPPFATALSIVNLVLLCEIWLIMLYLTSIRNFRVITLSWIIGVVIAILLAIYIAKPYRLNGMLLSFNAGLIFILFAIKACILSEYNYRFLPPKDFVYYFKHYKGLFWSGFMLFAGMWVDKVIMWTSPDAITHLNNLRTYPTYDGAMFLSYLSIVPVMGLFILSLETNFYDSYIQYVRNIETNAPLFFIEEQKRSMIVRVLENGRTFLFLQGSITAVVICAAPIFYNWFTYDYLQMAIFRLGALGAFFNALNLFIVILFSYFDSQENMLKLTATMLLSNAILTIICRYLGFQFYGVGYCLSMILSFFTGAILFTRFMKKMTYYIFINNVVKRHDVLKAEPIALETRWPGAAE